MFNLVFFKLIFSALLRFSLAPHRTSPIHHLVHVPALPALGQHMLPHIELLLDLGPVTHQLSSHQGSPHPHLNPPTVVLTPLSSSKVSSPFLRGFHLPPDIPVIRAMGRGYPIPFPGQFWGVNIPLAMFTSTHLVHHSVLTDHKLPMVCELWFQIFSKLGSPKIQEASPFFPLLPFSQVAVGLQLSVGVLRGGLACFACHVWWVVSCMTSSGT